MTTTARAPSLVGSTAVHAAAKSRATRRWQRLPMHLVLGALCLVWLVPVLGLLVTSFRKPGDVATTGWWTSISRPGMTLANYREAFSSVGLATGTLNTLVIAIPATAILVTVSALAGYAFAWMRFPGRQALFVGVVALMVIPAQVTLVPVLRLFIRLGLTGNVISVWVFQAGFTLPFGIFVLRNFFAALPKEILEAARVDGASDLRTFRSIVAPLSAPGLLSLGILFFIWSWNDLLVPLLFLGGQSDATPLTVDIAGLVQQNGEGENLLTAAALVSAVAPLFVFFSLQRYFVRGLLGGSVKG